MPDGFVGGMELPELPMLPGIVAPELLLPDPEPLFEPFDMLPEEPDVLESGVELVLSAGTPDMPPPDDVPEAPDMPLLVPLLPLP